MADIITTGVVIMTTMVVIVKEFLSSSQHGCHQKLVLRQLLSLRNNTVPNFEYSWCWYHQDQILIRNFLRANVDFYQDGTTLFPSYIIWPELPKKVASQESNCCQIWSKRALTTKNCLPMTTNFRKIEKQLGNSKEFKSRLERKI